MDIDNIKETIENYKALLRRAQLILRRIDEEVHNGVFLGNLMNVVLLGSNFDEYGLMTIYYGTGRNPDELGKRAFINVPLELFSSNQAEFKDALDKFIEEKKEEKKLLEEKQRKDIEARERKEYERLKAKYGKEG